MWGFADAAYPREGTVTVLRSCCSAKERRCSLSPRGDGYDGKYQAPRSRYLMQLIPARGRLSCTRGSSTRKRCDAAYPREGTVTILDVAFVAFFPMQLIPARGRLQEELAPLVNLEIDAAYPREGTVTDACGGEEKNKRMQLIPARGRLPNVSSVQNAVVMMQLIPARGRLHPLRQNHPHQRGCSLSPRGDGYVKSIACRSLYFQMQLIPARGRLPHGNAEVARLDDAA